MLDEALSLVPNGTDIDSNDGIDIVVGRDRDYAWVIDYLDGRCRRFLIARPPEEFFSIRFALFVALDQLAEPDSWKHSCESTPPDVAASWSY
jgi:hypothetical protein